MLDIGAGESEAVFDRIAQNETAEDGCGGDGISGKVSKHVDAVDRNGFGNALTSEAMIGDGDEFIGIHNIGWNNVA